MPFKIVQTVENGRPILSVIPSVWEENGKLFWPHKVKNCSRLIKDERCYPSPNWAILDCIVKRSNITTYLEAENECQIMANNTDTDIESPTVSFVAPAAATPDKQFEEMVRNLTQNSFNVTSMSSEANNPVTTNEVCLPVFDGAQFLANQALIMQTLNSHGQILQNLVDGLRNVTQKVAEISVQFEESVVKVLEQIEQPVSVTLLKDADPDHNKSFTFKQITDKEQLENLERSLMDKGERLKLKKLFSFLFQPCEGHGLTYAYKLLDSLLSREFLCKCSWSGGSRGNFSKIPIKDFKNFLNFFCDMIRSWDSSFTMAQTEKFFKLILKNAVKRKAIKDLRSSSKRSRKSEPKPTTSKVRAIEINNQNIQIGQIYTYGNQNKEVNEVAVIEVEEVNKGEEEEKQDNSDEDLC